MKIQFKNVGNTDKIKEVDVISLTVYEVKDALKEIDNYGMFLCIANLSIITEVGIIKIILRRSSYSGIVWLSDLKGNRISSNEKYNDDNQEAICLFDDVIKLLNKFCGKF